MNAKKTGLEIECKSSGVSYVGRDGFILEMKSYNSISAIKTIEGQYILERIENNEQKDFMSLNSEDALIQQVREWLPKDDKQAAKEVAFKGFKYIRCSGGVRVGSTHLTPQLVM